VPINIKPSQNDAGPPTNKASPDLNQKPLPIVAPHRYQNIGRLGTERHHRNLPSFEFPCFELWVLLKLRFRSRFGISLAKLSELHLRLRVNAGSCGHGDIEGYAIIDTAISGNMAELSLYTVTRRHIRIPKFGGPCLYAGG
jgi:hypothetical protein